MNNVKFFVGQNPIFGETAPRPNVKLFRTVSEIWREITLGDLSCNKTNVPSQYRLKFEIHIKQTK